MHDWCISHRVTCKGEEWNNTATITTVKLRRLPSLRKTLIHKPQTTEVIQWGITESLVSDYVDRQLPMDQRDQDSWGHDWHEAKKNRKKLSAMQSGLRLPSGVLLVAPISPCHHHDQPPIDGRRWRRPDGTRCARNGAGAPLSPRIAMQNHACETINAITPHC